MVLALFGEGLEIASIDAFHHEVEKGVFFNDFVDLDDVGVAETCC